MAQISEFKAALIGGGYRPNQFRVELSFPNYVGAGALAGQQAQFLCKAAQLPASIIENVPLSYRGRPVNVAGERAFEPWTVSIYADTSFNIRNALEQWSDGIQNYDTTLGKTVPTEYQVDLTVHALDRSGATIKSYKFYDAYPTMVAPMILDFEQNNQVGLFDVTFQYNYFTSATGREGGSFGVNVSVDTPIGSFPIAI
jgi:hypothetical protein